MRTDALIRRERAIALALDGRSYEQIAAEIGVARKVVCRILDGDIVKAELRRVQRERLAQLTRRTLAAADEAVEILLDVARNSRAPMPRVLAARTLLEMGVKLVESTEMAERLADLEKAVADSRPASEARPVPVRQSA